MKHETPQTVNLNYQGIAGHTWNMKHHKEWTWTIKRQQDRVCSVTVSKSIAVHIIIRWRFSASYFTCGMEGFFDSLFIISESSAAT